MPNKFLKGQWDAVAFAAVVLLAVSVVFGGASRDHALRLALVELAALPLLALSAGSLIQTGQWREHGFALRLLAAVISIPLIQLIPLPPGLWTTLPGREEMVLALELGGVEPGWAPLSLTPAQTWRSALALIPPVAIFLAVLSVDGPQRRRLVQACLAGAVVGIALGAAQLASGGERLYPWATTRAGSVNGFFANRNHLASYLLVALPFGLVLGSAALRRRNGNNGMLWFGALFAGIIVVALAAIRSRAGITLLVPILSASLLAGWIAAGRGRPKLGLLAIVGVIGAALTAVAILALPPIIERFDTQDAPESRFERWPLVAETAQSYLPLGSGLGSFDPVYRSVEPLAQLDSTFFNQAHNEYLEVWLETGWLGIAVLVGFLVWYLRRALRAWKAPASRTADMQRAASIGIAAILLHSVVDYPLRTVTIAVLFALCCGLLEAERRMPSLSDSAA